MSYNIEAFDVFEGKWKTKTPYSVTKNSFKSRSEAEKELKLFNNRLVKMNKKAESDLRCESYGGIQIPKMRIKKVK